MQAFTVQGATEEEAEDEKGRQLQGRAGTHLHQAVQDLAEEPIPTHLQHMVS